MYLPAQFKANDDAHAWDIMRAHPLAQVISVDASGFPFVSHLPLHLETRDTGAILLGHVARGNPHWRYLQARPEALAVFTGPHAYLSPKVYPDLTRVPTWSYVVVHARVQTQLLDGETAKDALLKQLIADHEPPYASQWRGLPQDYQEKMLHGIVAFEMRITQLQCKIKLNQHRPESHPAMHAAYAQGNPDEQALAEWMVRLGLVPKRPDSDDNTPSGAAS